MQRAMVLARYLEGIRQPALIAQALKTPDDEGVIDAYLRSAEFNTHLLRAKKDMASSVLDAIREQLHTFLDEYIGLGLDCNDPRVRAAVLKDLLDRGGTGATAKVALTTPEMYKRAISEYIEHEEPVETPSPLAPGSDPDGVQP